MPRHSAAVATPYEAPEGDLVESAAELLARPDLFAEHILGHKLWPIQRQILQAIPESPKVAVKACHASSKTFTAAEAVLWWVARFTDGIAITTAPTWKQVEKVLWSEIAKAIIGSRWPFPVPLTTELRLAPGNYAMGLSTDEGVRFQGFHGRILVVIDEGVGVPPDIWEAIDGIAAGGMVHVLALGNPTESAGIFYEAFGKTAWRKFTIDAFDTPNLAGLTEDDIANVPDVAWGDLTEKERDFLSVAPWPMLVTRRWVWEKYWEWGPDSPIYQSRVRGRFPEQDPHSLFSMLWLELAQHREALLGLPVEAGIDVAGPGDAETCLYIRKGSAIVALYTWRKPDPRAEIVAALLKYKDSDIVVKVDCVGVGWHLYTYLAERGFKVIPVNASEKPSPRAQKEFPDMKFRDLKAEVYWSMREQFRTGQISGLKDDVTVGQLAGIKYEEINGKIEIQSKKKARKEGQPSPDRAEALILCFADVAAPRMQVY